MPARRYVLGKRKRGRSAVSRAIGRARMRTGRSVRRRIKTSMLGTLGVHRFRRYVNGFNGWTSTASNDLSTDGTLVMSSVNNGSSSSANTYMETPFSLKFRFIDLKNESEFTSMFDAYRITGVMFTIQMINNPNATWALNSTGSQPGNTDNFYPRLYYAIDNDDANTESVSQIKERASCRNVVLRPNRVIKIWIPRPTTLTDVSGGTNKYASMKRSPWLDIAADTVDHYGLKGAIEYLGLTPPYASTAQLWKYKLEARYYFQCKDVR